MKKGIIVFKGKILEPPYVIRQEANRIIINDWAVYPFPEIKKPRKRPVFKVEPEIPEFQVPQKIQECLEDFRKSWTSGLVKDEKDLIKKAAGLERYGEDFIKDSRGKVTEVDAFIQDYESQKKALTQVLESKNIPFEETEKYHDVLIPVKKKWGVVALFNEAERMGITEKINKEEPAPYKYPHKSAEKFRQYIETGLKQEDMFIIDDGQIEAIPRNFVDEAAKKIPGFDTLGREEKVEALIKELSLDLTKSSFGALKSAVIFFPHLWWQRSSYGASSRFWLSLLNRLRACRYRVWAYYDTNVTLGNWASFLQNGWRLNLKVIYNLGLGDRNAIYVGEPTGHGWYYFTDQFVYEYAQLRRTVVYVHSCSTLSDMRLATAFLRKCACTYGGWSDPTSMNPEYCDRCDGVFWRSLVDLRSPTGTACRNLNEFDSDFECRGDPRCRVPCRILSQ
ncbi:MAG: hypothetical protein HXS46_09435 [Theionarchaea archaeon]|nr:MAG: hypothetical protein AYK18_15980 [Theionarchaea archaeon DG-70]MBU7010901.1 hypothetical protein [Theionarchaea archaeon]